MNTDPSQKLKILISICILSFALPSQTWANQGFYREFLSNSGIITVSGEQADEHHARINSIQIAHDQYREIRILNPDTGTTEILEFSDPTLKATYSLPFHGRFLKLQIKRREKAGLRTADLALASDDSHYVLVRSSFRPYQHFYQAIDFSSTGVCRKPDSVMFQKPAVDPAIEPYLDTPINIATQSLDPGCKRPPFASELDHLIAGITQVVSSREGSSSNNGKFLSCLNQHNLQHFSEEMKKDFNSSLKVPAEPTVVCDSRNNGSRGEFSEQGNLIYFRQPWTYGSSTEPESDSTSYYADTFFHESLHKAGIEDEDLVHDAVSCCGLEKAINGSAACGRLDQRVSDTNNRNARLIASMDTLAGFREFWIKVEKSTDEQRVNTFYDDFFNTLKSSRDEGGTRFSTCTKLSGKSQDECLNDFVQETDAKITQYFDSDCQSRFRDKKKPDQRALCQELKTQALNIVNTNVTNVCDSSKQNVLERSCLFASGVKKAEILAKAQKEGDLLDSHDVTPDDQSDLEKKKLRDAFLTSYATQIPALESAYVQIKEKYQDGRGISMFSSMISFMRKTMTDLQSDYVKCTTAGTSKADCAKTARDHFLYGKGGLNHFFKRVCPTYFTSTQNVSRPCKDISAMVMSAFTDSFASTCKTTDPAKQIGVPGNDLTCLFAASQGGLYNYQHYDELAKEKKLLNADGELDAIVPLQQAKEVAGAASKSGVQIKSVHMGDQANKKLAQDSSSSRGSHEQGHSGANRAPASEASPAYAFDPSRGFENQLTDELRHQPTPARKVLQDAGRVISDLAVPSAEAHTNDTSSLALKAPESIIPGGSAIGGDLESTRAINIGIVDPLSMIGQNSRSSRSKEESASKAQGQSTADKSVAASDAASGRSPASASGTPKGSTTSDQAKKSSHGHDAKTSAQSQDNKGHIPGAHDGTHLTKKQLLEFFKDHPREALEKLKGGALSSDLVADHVQAKDDLGHEHGSKDPQIKIWYNSKQGIFMGLPDL